MSSPHDDIPIEQLVAALRLDDFDSASAHDSSGTARARPVNWRTLTDDQARTAWDELRGWVEWVTVRYDIPEVIVPVCWWRHGALVEELSALHTAWEAAFDPSDGGFGPVGWHERLTIGRSRLKAVYPGSCVNGHQDRKPRSWSAVTDEGEWDAWAGAAHAR